MPKKTLRDKDQPRILGRKAYEAIAAVEGLKLSPESRSRLTKLLASDLSPEQRRAAIIRAHAPGRSGQAGGPNRGK